MAVCVLYCAYEVLYSTYVYKINRNGCVGDLTIITNLGDSSYLINSFAYFNQPSYAEVMEFLAGRYQNMIQIIMESELWSY